MVEQRSTQKKAIIALAALVMIWGYNWVAMKVAVRYSSSFDFAALRVLLGVLGLLPVVIFFHRLCCPGGRSLEHF